MKNNFCNKLKLAAVTGLLSILLFSSCDRDKFFDESLSLPSDNWPAEEALVFNLNIEDTISAYRFFINVRNSTSYEYNNIFFFLTTEYPGGGFSQDTIECQLAEKDGSWLGRGTGSYRDNRIFIRENLVFPRKGNYRLSLRQAMREEVLTGISEAGLRLEKQ